MRFTVKRISLVMLITEILADISEMVIRQIKETIFIIVKIGQYIVKVLYFFL